ncbi:hypothetical protein [uncultured Psychrobacter sp.]|uniref:hypothetical protein n=1 Tax=uncultured Psychrobacter sp. TaxID=259303 RepID=UPI0034586EEB
MKLNTLSLSLLLSCALVVPTLAMADSTDYSRAAVEVGTTSDTLPAEGSLQPGSGEILTTQPNIDNGYATETITENGTLDQGTLNQGTLNQGTMNQNSMNQGTMDQQGFDEELSQQSNVEAYPPVTTPANTDYAAPVEPEAPLADDNF